MIILHAVKIKIGRPEIFLHLITSFAEKKLKMKSGEEKVETICCVSISNKNG